MFVQDIKYLVINHQQTTSPQNAHRSLCNDCHKQLVCCFIEYCSYQSSLCLPVSQVYKGERWISQYSLDISSYQFLRTNSWRKWDLQRKAWQWPASGRRLLRKWNTSTIFKTTIRERKRAEENLDPEVISLQKGPSEAIRVI